MSDLFVIEPGSYLSKSGESVLVKKDSKTLLELELKFLKTVQVFGNVSISTPLLQEFLELGVELAYYTSSGHLYGHLSPLKPKNVHLRFAQYAMSQDAEFCLQYAIAIIEWKMNGCLKLLEEYGKNNDSVNFKESTVRLKEIKSSLQEAQELSSVLGKEGSFAKLYYECYGQLFKKPEFFQGRSRRPPLDIGNSLLSFVYTMITHKLTALCEGLGMDPYLGFLHKMEFGRVSLACDWIEPIRPLLCDWIVLKFFNLKMLGEADFEPGEEGGFLLNSEGKRQFFPLYYQELQKSRNFLYTDSDLTGIGRFLGDWTRQCLDAQKVVPIQ